MIRPQGPGQTSVHRSIPSNGPHLMSRTPGILSDGEKRRDYLEDGAECGGRVVGGGVWIAASGKIEFEASRAFCAVLCLVSHPFQMGGYAGGYGPGYACTYRHSRANVRPYCDH